MCFPIASAAGRVCSSWNRRRWRGGTGYLVFGRLRKPHKVMFIWCKKNQEKIIWNLSNHPKQVKSCVVLRILPNKSMASSCFFAFLAVLQGFWPFEGRRQLFIAQEEASLSPGTALVLLVAATLLVAPLSEALTGSGVRDWHPKGHFS